MDLGICITVFTRLQKRYFTIAIYSGGGRWGLEGLEPPNFENAGAEPLQNEPLYAQNTLI